MKNILKEKSHFLIICLFAILGMYLRLHNIGFGLPHSFFADEPELVEPAIKYTFQIKEILFNDKSYILIPVSYVYGTLPTYVTTIFIMAYSKGASVLHMQFPKENLYIVARVVAAIVSILCALATYLIYKAGFDKKSYAVFSFILVAINWKFIVHAHYVNADIYLTLIVLTQILLGTLYFKKTQNKRDTVLTILLGLFIGFGIGTKFTSAITLPLFMLLFLIRKDIKGIFGLLLCAIIAFCITNPFSIAYFGNFVGRIAEMKTKEAGLVFDSVDFGFFKYIFATISMAGFVTFLAAAGTIIYIIKVAIRNKQWKNEDLALNVFLIGHIAVYLAFYSMSQRRVDRWVLPIIPLVIIYCIYAVQQLELIIKNSKNKKFIVMGLLASLVLAQLPNTLHLLKQFQPDTPKSLAYKWAQKNIPQEKTKYSVTEEGLDPLNKLSFSTVIQYNAYESDKAYLQLPYSSQNPTPSYDYVFVSSKAKSYFDKPIVKKKYPEYYNAWETYYLNLVDKNKYQLVKEFLTPKPNLIPLSDVYIYKRID